MAKEAEVKELQSESLAGQLCPMCRTKNLTLTEGVSEVPFFGKVFVFGMHCSNCKYHKSDVEAAEQREPCKYTFEVSGKDDLNVRVIRSSEGFVKIPHVGSLEPGVNAEGFVTNIEGLIMRFKKQVELLRDSAEDDEDRKKAKNLLKKLQNVLWGSEKLKIIIEDATGNSAIVSDKAVRSKL
ncbi:ZPR1 zinc finger domain-containing protein [Candidatus Woesearchaeota archaeon]|nr:MAG: ZPR1 zinc finger domain-containing protein [Candidatus Woesearchaeota archaeon]